MNCLEARRAVLAQAYGDVPALASHIGKCATCAAFADGVRHLDAKLARALRVPVPEGLKERILLRQSIRGTTWKRSAYMLALAASVVLAAVHVGLRPVPQDALRDAVVHHLDEHVPSHSAAAMDTASVNANLRELGIELVQDLGGITFAQPCDIGRGRGAHLVVAGDKGPVTILIMPRSALRKQIGVTSGTMVGVIAPCPYGSIAILGAAAEAFGELQRRVEGAFKWI